MAGKKVTEQEIARIVELCKAKTSYDDIREIIKTEFNVVRPNSTFYNNYRRSVEKKEETVNA